MPLPLAQPSAQARTATRILDAARPLAIWHLASLDAPTVAVVWSLAFAWAGHRAFSIAIPALLFLVTWCVYAADRLIDSGAGLRASAHASLRERHYFHWRHRRILVPLTLAAACAAAALLLKMPGPFLRHGSILGLAALAYFLVEHIGNSSTRPLAQRLHRMMPKEFLVGALFTAGCVLPAWAGLHAQTAIASLWAFWIPGFTFAALAWLNCVCIAKWESAMRPEASFIAAGLLVFAGLLCSALAMAWNARAAALLACGALSALLLALLGRLRRRMTPLALRAAADLVLLTPLLLISFAWLLP